MMPTTKNNDAPESTESDLPASLIFELLADNRRYLTLRYLTQAVGAVHLSDLADQIALWEGEHTHERYERVCTSLVHVHVPKLTDAGVVRYDPERETVELLEAADAIAPYLELATPDVTP